MRQTITERINRMLNASGFSKRTIGETETKLGLIMRVVEDDLNELRYKLKKLEEINPSFLGMPIKIDASMPKNSFKFEFKTPESQEAYMKWAERLPLLMGECRELKKQLSVAENRLAVSRERCLKCKSQHTKLVGAGALVESGEYIENAEYLLIECLDCGSKTKQTTVSETME